LETPSRGGNFLGELDRFIRRDVCRRYRLATATMMSAASCARVVGSSEKDPRTFGRGKHAFR
jgi:hypothetical protein